MVGTIYLIRHGSTKIDGVKRYKGTIDVPLSDEGRHEMRCTASVLRELLERSGRKLDAVYTSALSRARESAALVAAPHGLEPIVITELRERHFGQWEGLSFDEISERWPRAFDDWASDPLNHKPVDGESTLEVSARVTCALDEIMGKHDGQDIAIVAHGGVNRAMLCSFLGVPLENIFRIEQDHGALSVIDFHDGYPVVRLMNYGGSP